MIVAISAISESGDHYLWCKTGTIGEIVYDLHHCDDFAYLGHVMVDPLQDSEQDSAEALRKAINKAIDKAMDNQ